MIVAIVAGGCAAVGVVIAVMAAILFPVMSQAREAARNAACQSNLKQISTALLMYANDYDEVLPQKENWQDAVMPYVKNPRVFSCPSAPDQAVGYAYNAMLDGEKLKYIQTPQLHPMVFDSLLGVPNGSDDLGSFALRHYSRSGGGKAGNVAYVDGAVNQDTAAPAAGRTAPRSPGAGR